MEDVEEDVEEEVEQRPREHECGSATATGAHSTAAGGIAGVQQRRRRAVWPSARVWLREAPGSRERSK